MRLLFRCRSQDCSWFTHKCRHTSEKLRVGFQTATVEQTLQQSGPDQRAGTSPSESPPERDGQGCTRVAGPVLAWAGGCALPLQGPTPPRASQGLLGGPSSMLSHRCSPGPTVSARSPSASPPGGRLGADPPVSTVATGTWDVPSAEVPALEQTASQEETGRKQL